MFPHSLIEKEMDTQTEKELIVGTFLDIEKKVSSSLNGSELCFVCTTENFDRFIRNQVKNNYKDTAILMRYEVSEEFAVEFLDSLQQYKAPFNKNWYYKNPLKEALKSLYRITDYTPKLYKSQKKGKQYAHIEKQLKKQKK